MTLYTSMSIGDHHKERWTLHHCNYIDHYRSLSSRDLPSQGVPLLQWQI